MWNWYREFDSLWPPHFKMNTEDLKKVEELVKPTYLKIKIWTHGWMHVQNVVEAARRIAEMEGVDPLPCQLAAYCHDLGRLEEEDRGLVKYKAGSPSAHAVLSVKPTEKILDALDLDQKTKNHIIEAVKLHNIRKYEGDNKILSILQDADRADGFNKFSILRFAHFNLEMKCDQPKNDLEIEEKFKWVVSEIAKDQILKDKMVHTLEYVMPWYDELMNTPSAKIILKDGYEFIKSYRDELKGK